MGAVERGIAAIFAQGLRKEGLPSFVAPGPDAKIFRVLIGPLPDAETYRRVKDRVDAIGLTTFAKKYVN
jgi:cell division septation protein DedD